MTRLELSDGEAHPVSIEFLGGYRLVRKLGEGARAEVFLGHPVREGSEAPSAAIKLFRPDVPRESVTAEIEALSRAAGPHTVELLDLATAPDGTTALILARAQGGSLARLLRQRSQVRAGEAITVLAPLASTIGRLHDAGVVHAALRADCVVFDAAGAPLLVGFGRARLVPPDLPAALRATEHGISADCDSFAALSRSVLALVHDDLAGSLADWFENGQIRGDEWLVEAQDRLFDLGDASSIDFEPEKHESPARLPNRAITAKPIREPRQPRERSATTASLALPDWVHSGLGPLTERLRSSLATVRPRVWVAAGAVAAALALAIVLVPSTGSDATAEPPASDPSTAAAPVPDGPVSGDDPVAALIALVEARDRCIRDLSVLCLDDVAQSGSAALAADQQLVRSVQDGTGAAEAWTLDPAQVTMTERLGDTALLEIDGATDSEPASVLLMKGEAGWRIRDYLE